MTQYKKHQRKTCQVTWCYRVSHRKLETFKSTFFHSIIMLDHLHSKQSPVSIHQLLTAIIRKFCIFSQVLTVQCVLFFYQIYHLTKRKKIQQNLPMCDMDATVGNIEYIVSFFLNQKITTRYIAQKSLTDRQYSIKCSKKVHKAVFHWSHSGF